MIARRPCVRLAGDRLHAVDYGPLFVDGLRPIYRRPGLQSLVMQPAKTICKKNAAGRFVLFHRLPSDAIRFLLRFPS
jgi:hypothetical protein